jgi:hypothetical protein
MLLLLLLLQVLLWVLLWVLLQPGLVYCPLRGSRQ